MKLSQFFIPFAILASVLCTTQATGHYKTRRKTVARYCPVEEIVVYETRAIEECMEISAVCHAIRQPCPQGEWYANIIDDCWTCCRR